MDFLLSVFSLSAITQTNKETIQSFSYIEAPGLHITHYYNIYKTVIIYNDDNNINNKNYLHRGPFPSCEKMTHKKKLEKSQNNF